MPVHTLKINEQARTINVPPDTPLLWVLRDHLNLPGTIDGGGMGLCGARTEHLNDASGSNGLAFVFQCFVVELAHAAGKDTCEFRLALLGADRVLPGSGQGITFHFSHGGYVDEVAEVSFTHDGILDVQRAVAAVDVGPILNYRGAESQMQGIRRLPLGRTDLQWS
jgi:CO/xanthine dehydrogenase Mo-binding subunit